MKKRINKAINIILPLILGVFLIYYSYKQFTLEQLDEIITHFKGANYNYIAISSIFSILSLWARSYRWKYALQYMGHQSSTTVNFMAINIGYIMNLTIPKSGEISRAVVLQKYKKIPFDKSFGSIVSERIIDLICLLICVFTSLFIQYDVLKDFLSAKIPLEKLALYTSIAICIAISSIVIFIYAKWKFILFIKKKLKGLVEGIVSLYKMPYKIQFIFFTLLIWGGYIATFYFGTLALAETSNLSFPMVMSAFVAGSFAVSFTNGGFGAFPLVISELLLLYHIPAVAGTAFGWILWSTQTAIIIILGTLSFLILPLLFKKK